MNFKELLQNRRAQLIIVVLVTLFAYINILQNGFAWDDRDFMLEWPQIKSEEGLPSYLSLPSLLAGDLPLGHRGVYRPIRSIYYLISYSIWGGNPLGYHLQAIIVHLLIVIVIYLITEIITKKRVIAFMVALLFATHPVHTEAVTYTAASMDTLGILFFFLSFYFYLKAGTGRFKSNILNLASIIYAFLAFFTYEMTLVLPLLIILYDFCEFKFSFRKLLGKINVYKNFFSLIVVYILIRFLLLKIGNRADYLGVIWNIAANQARVGVPEIIKNYASWLVWPMNLTISHEVPTQLLLNFLHLLNRVDSSGKLVDLSTSVVFVFPILFVLISVILIFFLFKTRPWVFFGLAWVLISLLPVLNILPQGEVLAERYLYIPSFGFAFILGSLFYYGLLVLKKNKSYRPLYLIVLAIFPMVVAFYSYQTILRNQDWKNEETIWQAAIKANPKNPLPYGALGAVYVMEGQYDKGIDFMNKNANLSESNPVIYSRIGIAYEQKGEIEKAIAQHQEALKLDPQYYYAYVYLGNIYLKQNNYNLAEKEYLKALEIKKDDPIILSNLGDTYYNQKEYDMALDFYKQALVLNSKSDTLFARLGSTYMKLLKYDLAIESYTKSLEFNPKQPQVYIEMANYYKQIKLMEQAKDILKAGIIIMKNDTQLQYALKALENN